MLHLNSLFRGKFVLRASLALLFILSFIAFIQQAFAHGAMRNPISRVYSCYLEGPEHPDTAPCQTAVAIGGTQPLYDWNEVNIRDANGRHRELIPDGKLCSAGREKYRAFDQARADWPTQLIAPDANGNFEFVYDAYVPHSTLYFEFYITKDGYDPTQPLKWSDLEEPAFCVKNNVTLENGQYRMSCDLPEKGGRHLIYSIWQRNDSPEAFYDCMDVVIDDGTITLTPTVLPVCSAPAWQPSTIYTAGNEVYHAGRKWQAQWWTENQEPGTTGEWGVWKDLGACINTTPTITQTPSPFTPTPSPTHDHEHPTNTPTPSPTHDHEHPTNTPTLPPTSTPTFTSTPTPLPSSTPTATATPTMSPPTNTPTPPAGCPGPFWNSAFIYTAGYEVSYAGKQWRAQWWTQGQVPGANGSGVWLDLGLCSTLTVTPTPTPSQVCTAPAWNANAIYLENAQVTYNNQQWRAQWWTQGQQPGATGPWGVWLSLGQCIPVTP